MTDTPIPPQASGDDREEPAPGAAGAPDPGPWPVGPAVPDAVPGTASARAAAPGQAPWWSGPAAPDAVTAVPAPAPHPAPGPVPAPPSYGPPAHTPPSYGPPSCSPPPGGAAGPEAVTAAGPVWPLPRPAGAGAAPAALPPVPPLPPLPPAYPAVPPALPPSVLAPHDPRARGRLIPVAAGIAVAAVALGAAAVWFVQRDEPARKPELHGPVTPSGSPSAPASPSPDPSSRAPEPPSGNPSGAPSEVPSGGASGTGSPSAGASGFPSAAPSAPSAPSVPSVPSAPSSPRRTVQDPKGFTLAVPEGWNREETSNGVFYRSPDRTALLQVFEVTEPELTPLDAVRAASEGLRTATRGYTEIRIGTVPDGSGAAELVYEYDSAESRGLRRGVERVLFAGGGKWAVLAAGPAGDWNRTQEDLAAALAAFRPGG
ncbi:hypothetical protein [Streptomyces sp. NPDC048603]|uniref:hypothetical protein n=1 Tax=Streptomyces sp. NPDC048603 TaxID=3365577 RepID=UPI00371A8A59